MGSTVMLRWVILLITTLGVVSCGDDDPGASTTGPDGDPGGPSPADSLAAIEETFSVDLTDGQTVDFTFVWIEPGSFLMGSPDDELNRELNEGPVHEVIISRGFWLQKYELTQGQWEAVMHTHPWVRQAFVIDDPERPAVYINWYDTQEYVAALNAAAGGGLYRLPTEAEWEYACRAGTSTRWHFGDDESQMVDYMWYKVNAWDKGEQYAMVPGGRLPNQWGLYDMHGNVWEWVQDWFAQDSYTDSTVVDPQGVAYGSMKVRKGGDFHYYPRGTRSARRGRSYPLFEVSVIGMRLVREAP